MVYNLYSSSYTFHYPCFDSSLYYLDRYIWQFHGSLLQSSCTLKAASIPSRNQITSLTCELPALTMSLYFERHVVKGQASLYKLKVLSPDVFRVVAIVALVFLHHGVLQRLHSSIVTYCSIQLFLFLFCITSFSVIGNGFWFADFYGLLTSLKNMFIF